MNNFNFYSPTFFAFGKDKENEAGELVASTKNYVQNYSASTKFSHKLQDGKYTIMTFADLDIRG